MDRECRYISLEWDANMRRDCQLVLITSICLYWCYFNEDVIQLSGRNGDGFNAWKIAKAARRTLASNMSTAKERQDKILLRIGRVFLRFSVLFWDYSFFVSEMLFAGFGIELHISRISFIRECWKCFIPIIITKWTL